MTVGTWIGDTFNISFANYPLITKVNLLFNNNLETARGEGGYSMIDKKNIVLTTTTVRSPGTECFIDALPWDCWLGYLAKKKISRANIDPP